MRKCSVGGCDKKHSARGFCPKHYMRYRKYDDVSIIHPRGAAPAGYNYESWRTWFDDKYGLKAFERLMDSLFDGYETLEAVGQEYGVTRERVRQWRNIIRRWNPEFASQRTQRKYFNILTRSRQIQEFEKTFPSSPAMLYVKKRAEEEGLTVEPIRIKAKSLQWHRHNLKINGIVWRISSIQKTLSRGVEYFHCGNFRQDGETNRNRIACCFDGSRMMAFIFPKGLLRGLNVFIHANLDERKNNGPAPKYNWRLYREAWHFLKPKGTQ